MNYEKYTPITTTQEVVGTGLNVLGQQIRAEGEIANIKNQRMNQMIDNVRNIATKSVQIKGIQEESTIQNYKLAKQFANNKFQDDFAKIDLQENKSSIQKTEEKKALLNTYKAESTTMLENLKAKNTFILGQSNLDITTLQENDDVFFNKLDNELQQEYITQSKIEAETNAKNAVNSYSTFASASAIAEQEKSVESYWNSRTDLTQPQIEAQKTYSRNMADKARFDLIKTNGLLMVEKNPAIAYDYFSNQIEALSKSSQYLPNLKDKSTRIEELISARKQALTGMKRNVADMSLNNLGVSITTTPEMVIDKVHNSPEYKLAKEKGDDEMMNILDNLAIKTNKEIKEDPISYLMKQKGNLTPLQRQEELNQLSLGNKTVLTKQEKESFNRSYDMIGLGDVKNERGETLTKEETFQSQINVSKALMQGDDTLLKKEANLNLSGLQAIAVQMELENNPNKKAFLSFMMIQNQEGKRPALYDTSQEKAKKATFINDNSYGSYLYATNPNLAEKMADAMIDAEIYSARDKRGSSIKVSDAKNILKPNYDYYVSNDRTTLLEVDKTKYDIDRITKQVNYVKKNIGKFFTRPDGKPLTEREAQNISGAGANITAKTNATENQIEFWFTGQEQGGEPVPLGVISFDQLPSQYSAPPVTLQNVRESLMPIRK